MTAKITPPSVSMQYGQTGASTRMNELGMRTMQERAYAKRGEQYLLIKSPPASGKSRALMFIALDKLANQGLKQAIIVVPERSIGGSFADAPTEPSRLLRRLAGRAAVEPVQRRRASTTRESRNRRSRPSASSWKAPTRCWSAPTPPSASPSRSWASRPSMTA